MKKLLSATLASVLLLSSCGNVQTKDEAQGTTTETTEGKTTESTETGTGAVPINVLATSSSEKIANIVRDQLTKSGFEVTLNLQPDYASYKAQVDAGNYDLNISGWTTVTGNPDYAVKSLFYTDGDYNTSKISDPKIDEYIDLAGSQTPEEYTQTYTEFEKYLVEEKAYLVPLYRGIKTQAVNTTIVDLASVRLSKSRSMVWEALSFLNPEENETKTLVTQQSSGTLTSLDPIKGNDGSINMLNTNTYVRLVNLTDDDVVVPDGSLSYNFSIADGNSEYYFLLRDDINFSAVVDKQAVDSGVRVGAEDVVYSVKRANDKESVPNHMTYTLHSATKDVEIVTDVESLKAVTSSNGKTVFEELQEKAPTDIATLTGDKTTVDNASGSYQVVKLTTETPFPQVLNYLAHQSAGIVSEEQVEAVNTYDISTYDPNVDIAYGDQSTITEGDTYNNTIMGSGPYVPIYKNDYEVVFEKNPGYMSNTEYAPKIKTITVKFIADTEAAFSALRAGDTYVQYSIPEVKVDIAKEDENLEVQEIPSNAVNYMVFNLEGEYGNEDLRKAVLYSINQDDIQAVFEGRAYPAYSTLSPLVETGNVLVADSAKVQEHLKNYAASK